MTDHQTQRLDEQDFIRHKLFDDNKSSFRRYMELVIGTISVRRLLMYEMITSLGPIPGAVGLFLRRQVYPLLFKQSGQGVVFGRNITIRNGNRICLGDRVLIDDNALLDGRGATDGSVVIGDRVIINRNVSIQAKVGPIHVGAHCDIGAYSCLISQGGLFIGENVSIGGGCMLGGGIIGRERRLTSLSAQEPVLAEIDDARSRFKLTKGPIHIGDGVAFGGGVTVLDGVRIGARAFIGAGAVVGQDIPRDTVVVPVHRLLLQPQGQREPEHEDLSGRPASTRKSRSAGAEARVNRAVYHAIDQVNEVLPRDQHLQKSLTANLAEELDSMCLVNFVLAVEEAIEDEFGQSIDLAALRNSPDDGNPLATVGSLLGHIGRLIAEEDHG